jgi:hypothetical protein
MPEPPTPETPRCIWRLMRVTLCGVSGVVSGLFRFSRARAWFFIFNVFGTAGPPPAEWKPPSLRFFLPSLRWFVRFHFARGGGFMVVTDLLKTVMVAWPRLSPAPPRHRESATRCGVEQPDHGFVSGWKVEEAEQSGGVCAPPQQDMVPHLAPRRSTEHEPAIAAGASTRKAAASRPRVSLVCHVVQLRRRKCRALRSVMAQKLLCTFVVTLSAFFPSSPFCLIV